MKNELANPATYTEDVKAFARAIWHLLRETAKKRDAYIHAREILSILQSHSRQWDSKGDIHVREAVNFMCAIGEPLDSSLDGYRYKDDPDALQSCVDRRRSRVVKQLAAISGLEGRIRKLRMKDQATLFEQDKVKA